MTPKAIAQTVTINPSGWSGAFSFTTAVAGNEPVQQSNALTTISYKQVGGGKMSKITVGAAGAGTWHNMSVVATNLTSSGGGAGAAQTVSLQNGVALDFITNIPQNAKNCSGKLQYTATPLFSEGSGTCTYTVTYTQSAL